MRDEESHQRRQSTRRSLATEPCTAFARQTCRQADPTAKACKTRLRNSPDDSFDFLVFFFQIYSPSHFVSTFGAFLRNPRSCQESPIHECSDTIFRAIPSDARSVKKGQTYSTRWIFVPSCPDSLLPSFSSNNCSSIAWIFRLLVRITIGDSFQFH